MKFKINIILRFLVIIFFNSVINAQVNDVPGVSSGDIQFYLDHSSFKGNDDKLIAEFYLMLFADQFDADKKTNENYIAEFSVSAKLFDVYNNEISNKDWTTEAAIDVDPDSRSKVIYDQWNEYLKPGSYKLKVTVSDLKGNKTGAAEYSFSLNEINDDLSASKIEFVSKIENKQSQGHFSKGKISIVPNPSRRYGVLNPILYIYYELYNLDASSGTLKINYEVTGESGETIKKYPEAGAQKNGTSAAVTHGLNVGNIPSGIYNLEITVKDPVDDNFIKLSRRFEVIQKDYAELKNSLSIEDAEVFGNILSIIGSPNQSKMYANLQLSGKAEFIVQFWKQLDPTPGTPQNEYLEKIQNRFAYANKNFAWGKNSGWETERGRVLIQYGMPDEIEQHQYEPDTNPYEIWVYRQEKKFIFVFGDMQDNGRFVLLHSDKEGEIYNDRWKENLRKL